MKKVIHYSFIILSISLQSCLKIIAKKYELDGKTPRLEKIEIKNKDVFFLGMSHLAKNEFYDNTKLLIADLQEKGYIFYVESITELKNKNIPIDTFSLKKLRKLTDLDLTIRFSNSKNPYLQKLKNKYTLVDQPSYESLGVKNFKRIDYSYTELINFYEMKYKVIALDSCDLKTDIRKDYNCETLNLTDKRNFTNDIVLNMRNKLIADSLVNSGDSKIVVIYGKMHLKGIKDYLKSK